MMSNMQHLLIGNLYDGVKLFDSSYQNPLLTLFLMLNREIVILTPLGIQNLNNKDKTKGILVVEVK